MVERAEELRDELETLFGECTEEELKEYGIANLKRMGMHEEEVQDSFCNDVITRYTSTAYELYGIDGLEAIGVLVNHLKPWKYESDTYFYSALHENLGRALVNKYQQREIIIQRYDRPFQVTPHPTPETTVPASDAPRSAEDLAQAHARITQLEAELQQAKARIAELEEALALCTEERNKAIDDLRDIAPNGRTPKHEYGTTRDQRIEALCLLLAKLEDLQPTEILGMVNTPGAKPVPGLGKVASAICGAASAGRRLTEVRKVVGSGGTTMNEGDRRGLISDINAVVKSIRAIRKK